MKPKNTQLLYINRDYEDIYAIYLVETEHIKPSVVKKLVGESIGRQYTFKKIRASQLLEKLYKINTKLLHRELENLKKLSATDQKFFDDKYLIDLKEHNKKLDLAKKSHYSCSIFTLEKMDVIELRKEKNKEVVNFYKWLNAYKNL